MATLSTRQGKLVFDFYYQGVRCRESTEFTDTPANRRKLAKTLRQIESAIAQDAFDYAIYFPRSRKIRQFAGQRVVDTPSPEFIPTFGAFAHAWYQENEPAWSTSHCKNTRQSLRTYIGPVFDGVRIDQIDKAQILAFRNDMLAGEYTREPPSNNFVNKVIATLRQVINEAVDRYGFKSPFIGYKKLRSEKSEVMPFDLEQVQQIIDNIRPSFKNYIIVKFFTGLRTSEVNALRWVHINPKEGLIHVREGYVRNEVTGLKNSSSNRDVIMSPEVAAAFEDQRKVTGGFDYVFCNDQGKPIDLANFTKRVWKPLLAQLEIAYRKPYDTRHTAATLMLAAGESPSFVAMQLGHSNTEMLFKVYNRFIRNLTRQDGSAFSALIGERLTI